MTGMGVLDLSQPPFPLWPSPPCRIPWESLGSKVLFVLAKSVDCSGIFFFHSLPASSYSGKGQDFSSLPQPEGGKTYLRLLLGNPPPEGAGADSPRGASSAAQWARHRMLCRKSTGSWRGRGLGGCTRHRLATAATIPEGRLRVSVSPAPVTGLAAEGFQLDGGDGSCPPAKPATSLSRRRSSAVLQLLPARCSWLASLLPCRG